VVKRTVAPKRRYRAHCIFCGHDAGPERPDPARCPRCKGELFIELDLDRLHAAPSPVERVVVAGRRHGKPRAQ